MLTSYPAKVLLLGEYTILNGSKALALPFSEFHGKWSFEDDGSEVRDNSRKSLFAFLDHPSAQNIEFARMQADMEKGLWFDSTIPQGFGVGSSGALIAAIYNCYGKASGILNQDKVSLARLEDYFHGSSSGLDPLVSHVNRPLLIHSFNEVEVIGSKMNLNGFFLLNTGKPRQTGPLVSVYKEKMKDPQFKQGCADVLAKDVNLAIDAVMTNETSNLFHHLWHISKFQWDFFPEMIPTQIRGHWARGLESGDYTLKLCGAGGGGFVLGYSEKLSPDELKAQIKEHELLML